MTRPPVPITRSSVLVRHPNNRALGDDGIRRLVYLDVGVVADMLQSTIFDIETTRDENPDGSIRWGWTGYIEGSWR